MHLPQTAEYALNAISHIASYTPLQSVRAKDLSVITRIPLPYLSKVLRRLVSQGLLQAQKGHGGGFVITRALEQINVAQILKAVDYDTNNEDCIFGWGQCSTAAPCPLHPSWFKVKKMFHKWAEETTLAQIRKEAIETGVVLPRPTALTAPAA